MSMWLTKAVNLAPNKIIIPVEDESFRGLIPSIDFVMDEKYVLSLTIDLSDEKYQPSEGFLEQLEVTPHLLTKNGSDILLDSAKVELKKERLETIYSVTVEFESILHPIYGIESKGRQDVLDSIDLSKLGFYLHSSAQEQTESLIYQIEHLSMFLDEDSHQSQTFTFEPGIVLGEDLPFEIEDFISSEKITDGSSEYYDASSDDVKESTEKTDSISLSDKDFPYATMKLGSFIAETVESVNHPNHYNDSEIETFEMFILMNASRPEKIIGALEFNIFKYRDRAKLKGNQTEDTEKMHWYLDKMELLFPEEVHLYQIYHQSKN